MNGCLAGNGQQWLQHAVLQPVGEGRTRGGQRVYPLCRQLQAKAVFLGRSNNQQPIKAAGGRACGSGAHWCWWLWPALVDDKEQVTLKWQSDASQASWLHRWASARLIWMRLAVQYRELRQRGEKLPGFQKAVLGSNAKAMLDDALLRIVADHFQLDETMRDAASFTARLQQHSGDLVPVADKRLKLISDMLSERADLDRTLNRNFPLAWAHAHRDIKAQLDALMGEGFLRQTPAPWLDELPRYLKGIRLRIDKLGGQIGKDRATVAELDALWQQYQARAAGRPLWQQPEPLVRYRFMLEEYRVSVFAQQLGTRMPVSDKRLREQWQLC